MKLVGIIGSPRGMKGATGKLLSATLDAAKAAGAEVTTFSLAELDVKPCRACDVCHKTGACATKDDFETIKAAVLAADGIVLASPNYIFSVSAQMKALFDRCCGLVHLQALEGKYAAAVVTGGGETDMVEDYMLHVMRFMGAWTVGSVGALGHQLADDAARSQLLAEAANLGRALVAAIETKRQFPEQEKGRAEFVARMKGLVTAMKDHWPYEHEYWKSRGRL